MFVVISVLFLLAGTILHDSLVSCKLDETQKPQGCKRSDSYVANFRSTVQSSTSYEKQWAQREYSPLNYKANKIAYARPRLQVDFKEYERFVFIDAGTRDPLGKDSAEKHFNRTSLFKSHAFKIYGFEADSAYYQKIEQAAPFFKPHDIELVPFAVWIENTTLTLSGKMGQLNSTATTTLQNDKKEEKTTISTPAIDFSEWVLKHITPTDFVILKMDIEEAEYAIIPHMIASGAICLIDEIFIEIHFNRRSKSGLQRQKR